MTKGNQAKGWAPFEPGSTITLRHACGEDGKQHTATIDVRRCEIVQGYDVGAYRWRVVATRCDDTLLMIDVDRHGFDQHGLVSPRPDDDAVPSDQLAAEGADR